MNKPPKRVDPKKSEAGKKAAATRRANAEAAAAVAAEEPQVTREPRGIDRAEPLPGRRRRVPLGIPALKMATKGRPGYVQRWVNDDGGRIAAAVQGGWEFALDYSSEEEDKRQTRVVGAKRNGHPLKAYLMEIREEFYAEDQAAKQQPIDEMEAAMRRGAPHEAATGTDRQRFYVPSEGITIDR